MARDGRLDSYEGYEEDAQQVYAVYLRKLEDIGRREDLSPKGKADARAKVEQEYRDKIAHLQGVATLSLKLDREHYTAALREARKSELQRLRRVLGDATLTHIYELRLGCMTAQEIADWHSAAVDDWETALLGELGAAVIEGRSTEATQGADRAIVSRLRQTPQTVQHIEAQLEELRHAEKDLERLDVQAYNARIADAFGVRADLIPVAQPAQEA